MKLVLFSFLFLCLSATVHAGQFTQRKCLLLPVTDSVDGVLGFKVYEHVEKFIKESTWCYYKSNSDIINILQNYREGLKSHLNNKEVIRALSEKIRAGSIIRIDLRSQVDGIDIELTVISDDGEDVYFKQKSHVDSDDPFILAQTIKNWLALYEKNIPYDGQIIGVLGDQFTIDVGRASLLRIGQGLKVVAPTKKKKHPLLREVVSWETELIARAKLFNLSEFQGRGKVTTYHAQRKLQVGDWVRIDKEVKTAQISNSDFPEFDQDNFGKLGTVGLRLEVGKGSVNTITTESQKIGGLQLGFHILTEVWATRNFWASLELGRRFATYKQEEGTVTGASNNVTAGVFKGKIGYKYLPLGFFYGPQIDGYLGYAKYSYNLDTQTADGFGDSGLAGILVGVRGNIPIHKLFRLYARLDFMPNPGFEEKTVIFGEDESTSSIEFELGTHYLYSNTISIDGSIQLTSNKAKFSGTREISYKDSLLRIGATFTF